MFPLFYLFSDWGILALRLALGAIFIVHGWPKIKSLKTTTQNFSAMGFRPGVFWGTLVALLEFFGGIAVVAGLAVQPVAALFAGELAVITFWKLGKKQAFVGGFEFDIILLAAAVALFTLGGGAFSLDKYLFLGGF